MSMMKLSEAAVAVQSATGLQRADILIDAVSTDSRQIKAGELFVALTGENFDGHGFVVDVLARGAAAALVTPAYAESHPDPRLLVVDDTLAGLGALAAWWRQRFDIPVIGVVGSNGKTTVKGMCAAILSAHFGAEQVLATAGNLNNAIGLPTMVLRLHKAHRAAVFEIGMNHPGETAALAMVAQASIALLNNAQREHQEFMKTVHAVAVEHAALIDALPPQGVAVINADDEYADLWRQHASGRQLLGAGMDRDADVRGEFSPKALGGRLKLHTPWGLAELHLSVPGEHNARNACLAAAASLAGGASLDSVVTGLEGFSSVKGRLQHRQALSSAALIDDSYNANPDSVRVAIDVLAGIPGKRIFVMGDMGEVGDQAGQFHDEVGGYAKSHGIDQLLCLGEHSRATAANFGAGATHFDRVEPLIKALLPQLDAHTTVLVKGSRFMRMERVADAVCATGGGIEKSLKGNPDAA